MEKQIKKYHAGYAWYFALRHPFGALWVEVRK